MSAADHPAGRGSGVELNLRLPGFALGGHERSVARLASWEEAHEPSAHDAGGGSVFTKAAPLCMARCDTLDFAKI